MGVWKPLIYLCLAAVLSLAPAAVSAESIESVYLTAYVGNSTVGHGFYLYSDFLAVDLRDEQTELDWDWVDGTFLQSSINNDDGSSTTLIAAAATSITNSLVYMYQASSINTPWQRIACAVSDTGYLNCSAGADNLLYICDNEEGLVRIGTTVLDGCSPLEIAFDDELSCPSVSSTLPTASTSVVSSSAVASVSASATASIPAPPCIGTAVPVAAHAYIGEDTTAYPLYLFSDFLAVDFSKDKTDLTSWSFDSTTGGNGYLQTIEGGTGRVLFASVYANDNSLVYMYEAVNIKPNWYYFGCTDTGGGILSCRSSVQAAAGIQPSMYVCDSADGLLRNGPVILDSCQAVTIELQYLCAATSSSSAASSVSVSSTSSSAQSSQSSSQLSSLLSSTTITSPGSYVSSSATTSSSLAVSSAVLSAVSSTTFSESLSQSASETASQSASRPSASQSVSQPSSQPVSQSVSQPSSQPASQSASQSASQPSASQSASQSVSRSSASQSVSQSVSQSTQSSPLSSIWSVSSPISSQPTAKSKGGMLSGTASSTGVVSTLISTARTTSGSHTSSQPPASSTSDEASFITSTVFSTNFITVTSCASTVTNCPADAKSTTIITEIIAISTTICPVTVVPSPTVTISVLEKTASHSKYNTDSTTVASLAIFSGAIVPSQHSKYHVDKSVTVSIGYSAKATITTKTSPLAGTVTEGSLDVTSATATDGVKVPTSTIVGGEGAGGTTGITSTNVLTNAASTLVQQTSETDTSAPVPTVVTAAAHPQMSGGLFGAAQALIAGTITLALLALI